MHHAAADVFRAERHPPLVFAPLRPLLRGSLRAIDLVGRRRRAAGLGRQHRGALVCSLSTKHAPAFPNFPFPFPPQVSHFCPTSRRIRQFSSGRTPAPGARVVYIDGAFDMFHPGHVAALRCARAFGDFLLCGVHSDEAVAQRRGRHHPILSLHERALSVLACKHVDEVILGAPPGVTADLLTTFNISVVLHDEGREAEDATEWDALEGGGASNGHSTHHPPPPPQNGASIGGGTAASEAAPLSPSGCDPYALAKAAGIYVAFHSPLPLTTAHIVGRILNNRAKYEARNAKKGAAERAYVTTHKTFVEEH